MNCPNCTVECEDKAQDCYACGVVFSKWQAKQEAKQAQAFTSPQAAGSPDAPAAAPSSGGFELGAQHIAIGLAASAALVVWLLERPPSGKPVSENAHRAKEHSVAFVPLKGWTVELNETERKDIEKTGEVDVGMGTVEYGWLRENVTELGRQGQGGGTIAILAGRGSVDEKRLALIARLAGLPDTSWSKDGKTKVDNMETPLFSAAGTRRVMTSAAQYRVFAGRPMLASAPQYGEQAFKATAALVPGADRTYVVLFITSGDEAAAQRPALDDFLAEVRVLERPLGFWHLFWFIDRQGPWGWLALFGLFSAIGWGFKGIFG